jgi:Xaa-Pro aminopeptidase
MLQKVREYLQKQKIDALFVSDKTNIFYLTGFRGSNGYVLVTKNHLYLFTDSRYTEKAEKNACEDCRIIDIAPGLFFMIHNVLVKHKVKSFGIEAQNLSVVFFKKLDSLNGFKIHPADNILSSVRALKRIEELKAIRQSQKLNEQLLKLILDHLKVGVTEADLAWQMQLIAKDLGCQKLAFDPIIAFGANSAMPHHEVSSKKKLKRGDMILIDMGVMVKNYASDMTRTFFTKEPTKQQRHVYETVLEANRRAIQAIAHGTIADEVDKAARKHISHSGYSKKFGHATGHGIGLDVHEMPRIAKGSEEILQAGMVITVEPGIYLPGKLGVRIEDMVEVTEKGKKILTNYTKELSDMVHKI